MFFNMDYRSFSVTSKISFRKNIFDLTFTDFQAGRQKLGTILEDKKFQNAVFKNVNTKNHSPKVSQIKNIL